MYGTVARMKLKPGMEQKMMEFNDGQSGEDGPKGMVFNYVYKLDSGQDEYILVVGFTDKAAYQANASSPEMHEQYEQYMTMMAAEPEWNDGEIVFSNVQG